MREMSHSKVEPLKNFIEVRWRKSCNLSLVYSLKEDEYTEEEKDNAPVHQEQLDEEKEELEELRESHLI
ncbi:unnamed protein product [Dibothriocephalus latus]|uniref:Uncharacterized protein n=1 Tax=Dibothriocephalus latus TaxID=60516 RepID=A0A3P7P3V1_DIBLA|nr:unnamed protein product [Dibothriocephalus latus]